MHWIKVATPRKSKVIDGTLKPVTIVVQGPHITRSPLTCLSSCVKEFVCFITYFTRSLLAQNAYTWTVTHSLLAREVTIQKLTFKFNNYTHVDCITKNMT
jgi:hypothetical protein